MKSSMFKPLETERLIIRNWQEHDRELFHLINSDDQVMKFFPYRREREQSDELMDWLIKFIDENGIGFTALELKKTHEVIGFTGLYKAKFPTVFKEPMIEIGWRLAPQFWGKGYASEAAKECLTYGFERLELNEIVSFAVHNNHPSFKVMQTIGMIADPARDYDHPDVPDTHPHLKRHLFYTISRQDWLAKNQ